MREKLFNIGAVGVLFGIAALNANAGREMYQGQNMMVIETRPSILRRLTGQVELSPADRAAYLEKLIRIEEEKEQMQKVYKEATKDNTK